jgi:hypothetical protein
MHLRNHAHVADVNILGERIGLNESSARFQDGGIAAELQHFPPPQTSQSQTVLNFAERFRNITSPQAHIGWI